jgi:hypothetical protein
MVLITQRLRRLRISNTLLSDSTRAPSSTHQTFPDLNHQPCTACRMKYPYSTHNFVCEIFLRFIDRYRLSNYDVHLRSSGCGVLY